MAGQGIQSQGLKNPSREPSVLRAAGLMGVATFMSRIMGLVREQVFAVFFGASNAMDAFIVAFRIPNLLRDLFAEGAMSASLVPTFTRARLEEGDRRAWRLAGLVFRVLLVLVGTLALLGMLFAPELVGLYAGAFKEVPGKFELTVRMTRIMFPFFPIVALAAAFMGILNACGIFFLPAFASALFNITSILVGLGVTLVLFQHGEAWGIHPIEGMALGVLAGGLVQALCQLPSLYKAGYRWEPRSAQDPAWKDDPALRRMLWMMIPGTVGLAATQVNILVNTILATSQGTGAASWLNYAFRLMQFPIGIFGVSLAAAVLPRVSRQWVQNDWDGVSQTLSRSLRQVMAINLPASAGLAFLGYPIIELIFQYGRFTPDDTARTAMALAMYSLGLTAYSGVKVLVPACYAMGNTRIPVLSSLVSVGATVSLNLMMVSRLGYWGLALGTSVGALLNFSFLLVATRKLLEAKGGELHFGPLFWAFLRHLGVALVMGLACYACYRGISHFFPEPLSQGVLSKGVVAFGRAVKLSLLIVLGACLVVLLARAFRIQDTNEVVDLFAQKIKKKLSRNRS